MPACGRMYPGAGGACRCSEIAGAPDAVAAEVVAQARDAEQGRHQEQAGDEDHPPGVEQQGLVGQGQHAAPGKFVHRQAKAQGATKEEFLLQAASLPGWYVPAFYDAVYKEDGTLQATVPNRPGVPERITKQIVRDFEQGSASVAMAMALICVVITTTLLIILNNVIGKKKY